MSEMKKTKRLPEPLGSYVIVRPKDIEKKTLSGLVLAYADEDRKRGAVIEGEVIAIGPLAFKDDMNPGGIPWYAVGDRVVFVKYGGKFITVDDELYIVFRYEDIMCRLPQSASLSDAEKDE